MSGSKKNKKGFSKKNPQWWLDLRNDKNKYNDFIAECKGKPYPAGTVMHEHHITPKSLFNENNKEEKAYCDSPANLIPLSREDHILAHKIRLEVYGNLVDQGAINLLEGGLDDKSVRVWRQLGADATHTILREEGRNFWDDNFQREMGLRSLARPDALEIRSRGGRVGGRNRNAGIAIQKTDQYVFSYKGEPVLCIFNCETGGDVVKILNSFVQTPIQRVTPLLDGSRQTAYSWSCTKLT